MLERRWVLVAAGLAVAVSAAVLAVVVRTRRRDVLAPEGFVDSSERRGRDVADRGSGGRVAFDVERLKKARPSEQTVQYLTYIQSRRGVDEHLLFVREADIEALAALEGDDPEEFLRRLQHLGVVISQN